MPKPVPVKVDGGDLALLAKQFERSMRAEDKAPGTIHVHTQALAQFARFLKDKGMPLNAASISREHVEEFLEYLKTTPMPRTGQPCKPNTVLSRWRSLRRFFGWLIEEGEIKDSPLARMKRPKGTPVITPMLDPDDLRKLLKACEGKDFLQRRDEAILRLFIDTGMRRSELAYLQVTDIDLDDSTVQLMGKGRKPRRAAFGRKCARSLDRYLRLRETHRFAKAAALWLGRRGPLQDGAVDLMIRRRAADAGVDHVYAHLLRHGQTDHLLRHGVQEGDVMSLMGWSDRAMLSRYGAAAAASRAHDAYRRVPSLSDLL